MSGLIVQEWIGEHGGSEKVVDAMVNTFPTSDLACLWNDAPHRYGENLVMESWMARTALRRNKKLALPLMSSTWKNMQLRSYDWLLVSSHLFAHHIASGRSVRHTPVFVYTHTPARYIWAPELDHRGRDPLARLGRSVFRRIDKKAVDDGDATIAANSHFVRERIQRVWERDAAVIYPPVGVRRLQEQRSWADLLMGRELEIFQALPAEFILGASRFVEYKDLPRVIEVGQNCDLPVVLAGAGPDLEKLQKRARESTCPVIFVDRPSDILLYALYQKAMLFVFPPIEDFGIMPVEAMCLGTPVLVNQEGGAAESASLLQGGIPLPVHGKSDDAHAVSAALALDMVQVQEKARMLSEEAFASNLKLWLGHDE